MAITNIGGGHPHPGPGCNLANARHDLSLEREEESEQDSGQSPTCWAQSDLEPLQLRVGSNSEATAGLREVSWLRLCDGLNVHVLRKFIVEILTPDVMVSGEGAFGR